MISTIRIAFTLSSLACISLTAHADFQSTFQPYKAALDRLCPSKRLDLMTPADLNDRIDPFLQSLPEADRRSLSADPSVRHACDHVEAGVSCQNIGYIDAIERRHLLNSFAESVCKVGMTCDPQKTGPGAQCGPGS